jgi:hypothetical protein
MAMQPIENFQQFPEAQEQEQPHSPQSMEEQSQAQPGRRRGTKRLKSKFKGGIIYYMQSSANV